MGGLVNGFGSDSSAVRAVEAGVDILLILPDEDGAVEAIMNAVRSGRIAEERINRSVRKILGYKWDLGLVQNRMVDMDKLPDKIGTKDHLLVAKQIARKAVTVLKNDNILPLERNGKKKILSIITSDLENYRTEIHRSGSPWPNEVVGDYFMTQVRRRYGSNIETARIDPSSTSVSLDSVRKKARNADIILCPVFSKARSASGKFGLPVSVVRFLDSLSGLGKPVIVLAMGSPYTIAAFPNAATYVCAYSDAEPVTEATVEVLFGEVPALGKLPVTIPGMFAYGEGIEIRQSLVRRDSPESVGLESDSLAQIDSVMTRAIRDKAFPGGQVLVAKDGAVVYSKSFGRLEYDSTSTRVNSNTLYDLASVTKVIATTSVIMKLYDEQKIQLDDSVAKYIPEFANNGKDGITIRNLLLHNGGLPPFKRLYLTVKSPQEALDSVYQTEMVYRTGDSTLYSDFDFILLAKIAERITGVSLDWLADSLFFKPLGMTRTMFQPDSVLWPNTAPTEFDSVVRKAIVRGTVHDENAYVLGGIAGHAGLFSTANDLSVFLQMILNGGSYGGKQFLRPETVNLFTTKQSATSSRALGWDTRTVNGYSSAGSLFSAKSFGHTGFTGTSVWVDPERKIFLILLANRVYPTRNNSKIGNIRPKIADIVIRALQK
jgi:CubicO group peptidase (beta-lactamase class C family)